MKSTQSDKGLKFDGAESISAPKVNKFKGNQHAGVQDANKTKNFGRSAGATTGNTARSLNAGPARAPSSGVPAFESAGKSFQAGTFKGSAQVRTPGGTRKFEPKSGCNYQGNCDMINEGRGPTKGNQQ